MANGRCRMHGGKSTGPRTPEGKARMRLAITTHGLYAGPDHPDFGGMPGPRWPGLQEDRRQTREAMRVLGWKRFYTVTQVRRWPQPRDPRTGRFVAG